MLHARLHLRARWRASLGAECHACESAGAQRCYFHFCWRKGIQEHGTASTVAHAQSHFVVLHTVRHQANKRAADLLKAHQQGLGRHIQLAAPERNVLYSCSYNSNTRPALEA
jgi:hypothetical protein